MGLAAHDSLVMKSILNVRCSIYRRFGEVWRSMGYIDHINLTISSVLRVN